MTLDKTYLELKKAMEEAATVAELEAAYEACRKFIFDNSDVVEFEKLINDAALTCSILRSQFSDRPYIDPATGDLVTKMGCFPI